MILTLRASISFTAAVAARGESKRSMSSIAASFAPPCNGPRRLPIAPVTAE
jgi:hypothetical protein